MRPTKLALSALAMLGVSSLSLAALATPGDPPAEAPRADAPQPLPAATNQVAAPDADADTAAPPPEVAKPEPRKARPRVESPAPVVVSPAPQAPEQPAEDPAQAAKPHQQHVSLGLAFLGSSVESKGFDPYSSDNTLAMATVFGTVTPWDSRPFSIHLAFEYAYGGNTASARGNTSSLDIHRLALGLEGRFMPISRMALFVRGMPAAIHLGGIIEDPYLSEKLGASTWTWGVDVTGGAAARVGAVGTNEHPKVSFWVGLDMGYRFAGAAPMNLRPGDVSAEDQTRHFGEVPMASLDLSGFIGRLSASISF